PNTSSTFSLCFHPVNTYGYSGGTITVGWQDSSGITGSVYVNPYGYTDYCMQPNGDSVQLDDVVTGGYVEASNMFIAGKDSILTFGGSYVWPDTAIVTIVSP